MLREKSWSRIKSMQLKTYWLEEKKLSEEKISLTKKLNLIEKKNNMLTDVIDLDYLETLYRKKFMLGKTDEKVFVD